MLCKIYEDVFTAERDYPWGQKKSSKEFDSRPSSKMCVCEREGKRYSCVIKKVPVDDNSFFACLFNSLNAFVNFFMSFLAYQKNVTWYEKFM